MSGHRPVSADPVIGLLLALAAVCLFTRLNNGVLWQDEAETAVLAQRVLKHGYPRAMDSRGQIEIPSAYSYGPRSSWVYSPWGQFYFLAFFFALFGESTLVARFPFAVLGWFSIWLAWRFAHASAAKLSVQRLTVVGLSLSVPFLIAMRQCRYYAMATVVFLAIGWVWLCFCRKPTFRHSIGLGLLMGLLFHVNFGTFIPTAGALLILALWQRPAGWQAHALVAAALTLFLILPWALIYCQPGDFIGEPSLLRTAKHLEYYIRVINKYLLPIAAVVASVGWVRWCSRRSFGLKDELSKTAWRFIAVMSVVHMLFLLVPDQRHLRYLIPLVPLFVLLQAVWLSRCLALHRLAGAVLAVLALGTGFLHSGKPRILLADFAYELTHRYRGPMDGVVEYLQSNSRQGQTVKIPYDDRTVLFYTGLTIELPSRFAEETFPDWIVIRRDWLPAGFFGSAYFQKIEVRYERIVLNAPDVRWQGREDPGTHPFRTAKGAPAVVLYRKRGGV